MRPLVKIERPRHIFFQVVLVRVGRKWGPSPSLADLTLQINEEVIAKHLWEVFIRFFGEAGAANAGLWVEMYDPETASGVVRCSHYVKYKVLAALAILRKIDIRGIPLEIIVSTVKTSGTIKRLLKKSELKDVG